MIINTIFVWKTDYYTVVYLQMLGIQHYIDMNIILRCGTGILMVLIDIAWPFLPETHYFP